ncbi:LytR/AlgR family response regulator transcription factor [Spirosoma endophyticum]|uniref:Two component transcriptional regulator, LytTR family n=1 Tax=Spirosoma endophyticum TaxID=662367 RepID=A0A1I2F3S0_9BACT|nr:LytTR family DNA-binding domain-containing protein [Spirosoma endophyticum]SFF00022.1 two component transcriptional regulator, LytTR family [Spirosoma endophyticum]
MTILIIEDEEPTARKLQRLLADVVAEGRVVGITGSVDESVEWLRANPKPDLIFMDIELADGQSFDIFNRISVASPVIFTTAYDEYAIKAFKVNSIDYLLKPVKEADLRQAINKLQALRDVLVDQKSKSGMNSLEASMANLLQHLQHIAPSATPHAVTTDRPRPMPFAFRDRFMIKQGQRLFSVSIDEVAFFFSRNKLSFLKTRDEHEWLVDYTMDELVQMLDPRRFFRLNRQVIAELRAVDKVHLYFNGKLKINLRPAFEEEVVVSREKAGELKLWLGE